MHIFQPQGDDLAKRPMLICAHGGAFVTGNKEHDNMLAFCNLFTVKGYVTATIQYRLGMNIASPASGERAVYRSLQDSRAAIRYIKENAVELGGDTSRIYFLGSSAGAFTALHNVSMNTEAERPASTHSINHTIPNLDDGPDLGGYDALENQYKHGSHPDAVISLWGALKHPDLIQDGDEEIPVLLVHGMADDIVPFGTGSPFNAPTLSPTYGSDPISKRFTAINYPHETYFVPGKKHEFYGVLNGNWNPAPNAYWDTVTVKTARFLYKLHKPTADFSSSITDKEVQLTDQSSANATAWHWDFGDGQTSTNQNTAHTYAQNGTYKIILTIANEISSWDTSSAVITVNSTAVNNDNIGLPKKNILRPAYPNPFNPETCICYELAKNTEVKLLVVDLLGKTVRNLRNAPQAPGYYTARWDGKDNQGRDLPSGIYMIILNTGAARQANKVILLK